LHLPLVPFRREQLRREVGFVLDWYNAYRPHTSLGGKTPDEVYFHRRPANRSPRFEPRRGWPRGSPCAKPWALVRGKPGGDIEMDIAYHGGRNRVPIVRPRRAA
jgi:hypothetical protein